MTDDVGQQIETHRDAIGRIEMELLTLDRSLEMFGRRNDLYRRVDRAGYLVLRTLCDVGPMTVNRLSDVLGLHASTVTRQVNRLEKNGYISRRVNRDDQRSSSIALNASGRRIMSTVEGDRRQRIESLLAEWSHKERESLGNIMAKLNASIANSGIFEQRQEPRTRRDVDEQV